MEQAGCARAARSRPQRLTGFPPGVARGRHGRRWAGASRKGGRSFTWIVASSRAILAAIPRASSLESQRYPWKAPLLHRPHLLMTSVSGLMWYRAVVPPDAEGVGPVPIGGQPQGYRGPLEYRLQLSPHEGRPRLIPEDR